MRLCTPQAPLTIDNCRAQLINFFSKNLLRHPKARSTLAEMTDETIFQRYIPEASADLAAPEEIRRHILCSGTR